ncbi:replicative DNA helicase [Williamsoniiplasma somnilux]|uniref:Replicative DNA helicase n=1 Tax=Williamsoniiplasma somnilux TaxID=215578 RepID=A0A2K8P243_9MOLU|nr:replicative DNA helicase [Williamsoniiplasma somnilux]ATZ19081.1 replicative DNA helicase [Williamsoniiplasma somnilux]
MDLQNLELDHQNLITTEKMVLAIAIHSPKALPDILMRLTSNDFLIAPHKIIFAAISQLQSESKPITSITIADELTNNKQLTQAGNIEYIAEISGAFYTDVAIDEYIDIVYKASMGRKFDQTLIDIQSSRKKDANLSNVLTLAQQEILNIDLETKKSDVQSIGGSMTALIEKIHDLEQREDSLTGVTTGYSKLDKITAGLQAGDFIILAARPSMGKTAFALNIAQNAAINNRQKNSVAIFSIEMPREQLTQRMLSTLTVIDSNKLRTGKGLTAEEWNAIHKANDRLQATKIFIDDTPGITVQQIQSKLYKLKRDEGITLCVIDYLQLISSPGNGADRQNEISTISRQLKRIARDTGIPIICLSQLSRSVEKREDKKPIMSDLRDSGAIEQDADIIMFLYRDEYYKNSTTDDRDLNPIQETNLIIAKHRNGSTGIINLQFNLKYGKFLDSIK